MKRELKCDVCGTTMIVDDVENCGYFNKNYYYCENCGCGCIEYERNNKPTKRVWYADDFGFQKEWVEFLGGNGNEKK